MLILIMRSFVSVLEIEKAEWADLSKRFIKHKDFNTAIECQAIAVEIGNIRKTLILNQ